MSEMMRLSVTMPGVELMDVNKVKDTDHRILPLVAAMHRLPGIRPTSWHCGGGDCVGVHTYRVFFEADFNQPGILGFVYFTDGGWNINMYTGDGRVYFMLTAVNWHYRDHESQNEVFEDAPPGNQYYTYGEEAYKRGQELADSINAQVDGTTPKNHRTYKDPCIKAPYGWGGRIPMEKRKR